ncbi:hypothetical protein GDO86_009524 [Hymenochirus boettgeri]|uniref:Uncharacterized protein n=1 Tax=Hymenochirus boettgeri TaxID=247094 RepID=A0A8T2JLG9_9PIPI|nr:hypothetical protein GDO86_009524 [Hymenochirus boettgeri]
MFINVQYRKFAILCQHCKIPIIIRISQRHLYFSQCIKIAIPCCISHRIPQQSLMATRYHHKVPLTGVSLWPCSYRSFINPLYKLGLILRVYKNVIYHGYDGCIKIIMVSPADI